MKTFPPTRIMIGRDVRVLGRDGSCVRLESAWRLRPGQRVEILSAEGTHAASVIAVVETWRISALAGRGPTYRGECREEGAKGTSYPDATQPVTSTTSARPVA